MDVAAQFRKRLRKLIREKYRSLDHFYLETDFSKGHLSEILRGKGSPSVDTLVKLAKSLDVDVGDFFVFPERSDRDRVIELLRSASPQKIRQTLEELAKE
jgi:transcriptional regulator with XRE-family HTH domain